MAQNIQTIRQSLKTPLPVYANVGAVNPTVAASGDSTKAMDPPLFSHNIAASAYADHCNLTFLGNLPQTGTVIDRHEVAPETTFEHKNEGDVVRAAALYLIHPVNQTLAVNTSIAGTIVCQSEFTTQKVRSDMTYWKNTAGGRKQFAVVEFKKRTSIPAAEFARAAKHAGTTPDPATITKIATLAYQQPDGTYFSGNSKMLLKQAGSYAVAHNCKYVALFDWDHLVLIRFVQLSGQSVGEYCETTVIPSTSRDVRAALAGFLGDAYDNA